LSSSFFSIFSFFLLANSYTRLIKTPLCRTCHLALVWGFPLTPKRFPHSFLARPTVLDFFPCLVSSFCALRHYSPQAFFRLGATAGLVAAPPLTARIASRLMGVLSEFFARSGIGPQLYFLAWLSSFVWASWTRAVFFSLPVFRLVLRPSFMLVDGTPCSASYDFFLVPFPFWCQAPSLFSLFEFFWPATRSHPTDARRNPVSPLHVCAGALLNQDGSLPIQLDYQACHPIFEGSFCTPDIMSFSQRSWRSWDPLRKTVCVLRFFSVFPSTCMIT